MGIDLQTASNGFALAVSDQDGGFIATYVAGAGPITVNLQRFGTAGSPLWTPTAAAGGVQMGANLFSFGELMAVSDQTGGALVAFAVGASLANGWTRTEHKPTAVACSSRARNTQGRSTGRHF